MNDAFRTTPAVPSQAEFRQKRNRIAQLCEAIHAEKQHIQLQKERVAELTQHANAMEQKRIGLEEKRRSVPPESKAILQQFTVQLHIRSVEASEALAALNKAQQLLFSLRTECRRKQMLVAKVCETWSS